MENVQKIARIVLGLILIMFGVNNFFGNFLHLPSMPDGAEAVFNNIGYLIMYVKMFEILIGVALMVNRFVPLALLVLAPISFNILLFHILFYPGGILPGLLVALLNAYLIYCNFSFYKPFFESKTA